MEKKAGIFFGVILLAVAFVAGFVVGAGSVKFDVPFLSPAPVLSPPSNSISNNDIKVHADKIEIFVPNAKIVNYDSTGSMNPILNENANGIVIVPKSVDEIEVGDIVSYESGENVIVHRIIEKSSDDGGVYFVAQGDNSDTSEIIRYSQIKGKIVGILY